MADESFLPIKVVFKQDGDYRPLKPRKIDDPKPLEVVTPQRREQLAKEVEAVKVHFASSFSAWPGLPAVAKVTLNELAIAKYRRPGQLFNKDTCPIIGGGKPTELYASVLPAGLDAIAQRIRQSAGGDIDGNISAISTIKPYGLHDTLRGCSLDEISRSLQSRPGQPLKLRMFRHASATANAALVDALYRYFNDLKVTEIEMLDYAPSISVYALHEVPPSSITSIASFIGTQSLSPFPQFRLVRTASRALGSVTATNFPPPDSNRTYGIVGIIDTGTDLDNPHLQAWVVGRHSHHPPSQLNSDHGSFVAGLVIHPRLLNQGDRRFPDVSSRIVDVVAVDRTGETNEYDLRTIIDDSLRRFPNVKVWNMSLAMDDRTCRDDDFSEFAAFIDEKSRAHKVLFHLPAGNYGQVPLRGWPPEPGIGEDDRICPPADSTYAMVVGSVAHRESASSRVRQGEPSPFTRRGPGGAYLTKPELAACGGNADASKGSLQIGVLSLDGTGHIAESIGTSFASPQIASISAYLHSELSVRGENAEAALIKAIQLHAAFVANGPLDRNRMRYLGLGAPPEVASILSCTHSSATCIFQIPVTTSPEFVRRPFPMPACLMGESGLVAEVFMTLYYEPPVDRRFGAEYCRCNVAASLGTVRKKMDKAKGLEVEHHIKEIDSVPEELDEGWEVDLIKSGYKWSPLKLYHHRFKKGPTEYDWQLHLNLARRAEFQIAGHQDVYLLVTVRDPDGKKPVYNEMVRAMQRLGWDMANLQLRSRARIGDSGVSPSE